MGKVYTEAVARVRLAKRFLVVSHVNPEGDAVGSLLGAALGLRSMGKDVTAFLEDPLPELFGFLPGADTVVHSLDGLAPFDVTIAVDCGEKDRLGAGFMAFDEPGMIINIDHHATNDRFGEVNVIDPDASAAGEMVFDFLKAAGVELDADMATNLYVAIHTDTGSFRYNSSTPSAFKAAGELVALGADPWEVSNRVYENMPLKKFQLLGKVLTTLEVIDDGPFKVATLFLSQDMMQSVGAGKEHADGFVNYARSVEGVEVGLLISETASGSCKVSLRGAGSVDVAAIAQRFGGGGHRNAAGFAMDGSYEEVRRTVADALKGIREEKAQ